MRVFRLRSDVNHYRYFLTQRAEDCMLLNLDCTPRAHRWAPPPVFVYKPGHQAGDFYQFDHSAVITTPRATEALRGFLETAGELLPLPHEGQEFTVLNVLECVNCLDHEATTWARVPETGQRIRPIQYAFHSDRFSDSPLFKIPETSRAEVLLAEGLPGRTTEKEFRAAIEAAQLKGLCFDELWSDEG